MFDGDRHIGRIMWTHAAPATNVDLTRIVLGATFQFMARYKGRMSPKAIEREFPHVVEIAVPPGGLGAQLDAMHYFHRARGIEACLGLGRRDKGRDYLRWYFTRPTAADAFAAEFGGTVINASR